MDALAGLLDGPRARDAFLLRAILAPPWSMRIQDEAPLTVIAMLGGLAWIMAEGSPVQVPRGGWRSCAAQRRTSSPTGRTRRPR